MFSSQQESKELESPERCACCASFGREWAHLDRLALVSNRVSSISHYWLMKIFRALGLAVGIIVLKLLMGEVFFAFEATLLQFFKLLQTIMATTQHGFGA